MKVLLFNGSPHRAGCTYTALHEVEKQLHKHGIETEIYQVGAQPVAGCIGCGKCEPRCPYGLPIRSMLKKCAEEFGE